MRIALDTNVMAYAEAVNGARRQDQARAILADHLDDDILLPVQALAELFRVLVRKTSCPTADAAGRVKRWIELYEVIPTDAALLESATSLVAAHRIGFWDSIVLASAAAAECEVLLSEDMQDGFAWRGVTIRNPFVD